MNIEVIATEYIDGQRVDTVKHTYNLSDDYITLGKLYNALGEQMAKHEDTSRVKAMINTIQEYIKGYGD